MTEIVESRLPCPKCPSSDAYHLYSDGHGYCFSCSTYFSNNKKAEDFLSDNYTYEYLSHRGIDKNTFKFYDVKTKIDENGKPVSLGFQYTDKIFKVRPLDKKDFFVKNTSGGTNEELNKAGLFGRNKFAAGSHKYVTITEGELDALSLYQVLHSPVVSVQSAATASRDCALDRSWLNSFERVYLAFDNDEAGRNAERAVAKLFDYNKIYVLRFTNRKDANDYLQNNEADELRNIWGNAKKYLPETIVSSFAEFRKILSEKRKPSVSYPFPTLSEMTYGIRTSESVLLTAQEGVGKTELMHAIEYHLLKETDDAIGAIFLEEPKQRHLQALAGIHLQKPTHLPDSGCTEAEIANAVEDLVGMDERLHIYSHFGSDDPRVLEDEIRFLVSARGCRYILFDHITMAVTGLLGESDERRALDYLSTRLEMMVKELDFSLIFVSHVNDYGQTRGSRYLGKIADIRIDATRDLTNPDPNLRNTVSLVVPKNRPIGKTGPAGNYIFDQYTRRYTEDYVYATQKHESFEAGLLVA